MKKLELNGLFEELTDSEMEHTNGGEGLWVQAGDALGRGFRFILEAFENPPSLPSAGKYK